MSKEVHYILAACCKAPKHAKMKRFDPKVQDKRHLDIITPYLETHFTLQISRQIAGPHGPRLALGGHRSGQGRCRQRGEAAAGEAGTRKGATRAEDLGGGVRRGLNRLLSTSSNLPSSDKVARSIHTRENKNS